MDQHIEHFGVKGMRWGVRKAPTKAQKQARARAKGYGARDAAKDPKTIRGSLAVRKTLIDSGQLSRRDANKGAARFGRNVALGLLGGALAGVSVSAALMAGSG